MITAAQMLEAVGEEVCWERGSDHAWECDALIGYEALRALVVLAAKAPLHEKRKLFAHIEGLVNK